MMAGSILNQLTKKASDGDVSAILWLLKTPENERLFEIRNFLCKQTVGVGHC